MRGSTLATHAGGIRTRTSLGLQSVWLIAPFLLLPCFYLVLHGMYQAVVAIMVFAVLAALWTVSRTTALVFLFGFLLLLGDIRRIVAMLAGYPSLDPLLLVGAAFTLYLSLPILVRLKVTSPIEKAVLALLALMFLEVFNPRQGSILVGFAGALFYIVPVLWFWVARRFSTDRMFFLVFFRVFVWLGVAAGLLGIYQTYIGFLPWEQAWIDGPAAATDALHLGLHAIRSFAFCASSVEYGDLLLIASICVLAAILSGRRTYALLLPILLPAMVLASMRGAIVKLLFASAMMWAVRGRGGRNWLPRLFLALALGVGSLWYGLSQTVKPSDEPPRGTTADLATAHVTQGLAHPEQSTAGGVIGACLRTELQPVSSHRSGSGWGRAHWDRQNLRHRPRFDRGRHQRHVRDDGLHRRALVPLHCGSNSSTGLRRT